MSQITTTVTVQSPEPGLDQNTPGHLATMSDSGSETEVRMMVAEPNTSVSTSLSSYPRALTPEPMLGVVSNPSIMPGSSTSSTSTTTLVSDRQYKSFPHTADLLGSASEASSSRSRLASPAEEVTGGPSRSSSQDDHSSPPRRRRRLSAQSSSPRSSNTRRPYHLTTRPIRPRVDPEPPHLAEFERATSPGLGFNELGFTQPTPLPLPQAEQIAGAESQNASQGWTSPPLQSPASSSLSVPITDPISSTGRQSPPTMPTMPPRGLAALMTNYGITGNALAGQNSSNVSEAGSATVPPPRFARAVDPALDDAPLDFSPQRTRPYPQPSRPNSDSMPSLTRSTSVGTAFRNRHHIDRLNRLDQMRNQASTSSSTSSSNSPQSERIAAIRNFIYQLHQPDTAESMDVDQRSDAPQAFGFNTEINRWNQSVQDAVGRRISAERPRSPSSMQQFRERLAARQTSRAWRSGHDSNQVSGSTSSDSQERFRGTGPDDLWGELLGARQTGQSRRARQVQSASSSSSDSRDRFRGNGPDDLWGEMLGAHSTINRYRGAEEVAIAARPSDNWRPLRLPRAFETPEQRPQASGMNREASEASVPPPRRRTGGSEYIESILRAYTGWQGPDTEETVANRPYPYPYSREESMGNLAPHWYSDDIGLNTQWIPQQFFSSLGPMPRQPYTPHVPYGHSGPHPSCFHQFQFRDDMTKEDKLEVARAISKTVMRWPMECRRGAAAGVLKVTTYAKVDAELGDIEKDVFCSVCHDEYQDDTNVTVTPCKHMYHRSCMTTWLETPNVSSCPMCRRDLAVLACLTKMVPTKDSSEAMPLWLSM